ncbi:MAG: PfkB family carbohydrate kinase [bacterium]|nr:PfkB family carbohydrate kinase [bacterium]
MQRKQFVTIGLNPCIDINCIAEKLKVDDVIRIKEKKISAGGKAFNIAKFLYKHNQYVKPIGIIGGHNGIIFKKLLRTENIPVNHLIKINNDIRENYNFFLKMALC